MRNNSHTRRRSSYVPRWVTEDFAFTDEGPIKYQLEGEAREKQLRWWHEDKSGWFQNGPTKWWRKQTHGMLRSYMRQRLAILIDDLEGPVSNIRRFRNPPFWD